MHFLTYIAGRLNDSILQSVATPPSGQVEVSKKRSADDSPTSLPISDARTARAATRASVVAGNFNQRATPPNTSQRDARAASHPFAGINDIVLRHFSHFHSFRFTGSSSIPGNNRPCCKAGLCS